jgi:15-cis-phytoene synthase / lycopene beta-cyclase
LADDLVDNSLDPISAMSWIAKLERHLDLAFALPGRLLPEDPKALSFIQNNFPDTAWPALEYVPTHMLPSKPLYELLKGFKMDLAFSDKDEFPIKDEKTLELYALRVASTVGEMCVHLVFRHCTAHQFMPDVCLTEAAQRMGIALQYINIARDISVDAAMSRVYLPTTWLEEEGLTPRSVLKEPSGPPVFKVQRRLLQKAFDLYRKSRFVMALLPDQARGPMIVAVESYMEIGRVLSESPGGHLGDGKRASVPKSRRGWVAWKTMMTE